MLLSPEITVGTTAARAITVRLEDVLLFVMTLGWMFRIAILKDIGFILRSPMNLPIVAYSLSAILSTTLGALNGTVEPLTGIFFVSKFIEYFFLYKVIINYVRGEHAVDNLVTVLLAVCGAVVLYCFYQILTGGDVAAPFEGSVGERNTLGGYLVLMGALAAGVFLNTENRREKYVLGALLSGILVVLAFSLSRSGWGSALIVAAVLFFFARHRGVYAGIVLAGIIAIMLFSPTSLEERLNYTFQQELHPGKQISIGSIRLDTSTSARLFAARMVLKRFMDHPFFGHGVTGFAFVDGQFIRVLAEMGLIGLCAFLWLLAELHRTIKVALHLELAGRLRGVVVGFYAAFWGLIGHALTANTFIIVRIAEPFWCLAGLVVVLALSQHHNKESASQEQAGASLDGCQFVTTGGSA